MALAVNTMRPYDTAGPITDNEHPVKASSTIWDGSAVGLTAGYARALVAGDIFAGFALSKVIGTGSDGGKNVNVRSAARVQLTITAAVTDVDAAVYASDDGTFTLAAGANTFIGKIHRWVSSTVSIVSFDTSNSV